MSQESSHDEVTDNFDYFSNPSWRIFRIMSEFVEGFTFLAKIQKSVTFFGSARLPENNRYYKMAYTLGKRLAQEGYTIVTGGGPGIMQAGNQGAFEADGKSVGINIQLPAEQRVNPYVKDSISLHYFFSRKVMLDFSAEAYVFFPGGYGTMDEFFELITLIQTGKMSKDVPVIMMGTDFWQPLADWMENTMLNKLETISAKDLDLWTLTDDIDEAVSLITRQVDKQEAKRVIKKGRKNKTPEDKLREATRPMAGTEQ
ncbi:MAG: TIGR00730 family Rossman fold protein [Chloroflexi bacterium]|nr:TIGR00730 family Rossman fold protein [Chloroflexota bacterium]OJV97528.1 MAG: Rossman fold protein, TIGR00730 family [Chloroflexi bacterium 54-19]